MLDEPRRRPAENRCPTVLQHMRSDVDVVEAVVAAVVEAAALAADLAAALSAAAAVVVGVAQGVGAEEGIPGNPS